MDLMNNDTDIPKGFADSSIIEGWNGERYGKLKDFPVVEDFMDAVGAYDGIKPLASDILTRWGQSCIGACSESGEGWHFHPVDAPGRGRFPIWQSGED